MVILPRFIYQRLAFFGRGGVKEVNRNSYMKSKTKSEVIPEGVHIGAYTYVPPATIVMIQAHSNYSMIYLNDCQTIIVSICLKQLESRFAPFHTFTRIHKSYLINLDYFKYYHKKQVVLENDLKCVVSRRKISQLKRMTLAQKIKDSIAA